MFLFELSRPAELGTALKEAEHVRHFKWRLMELQWDGAFGEEDEREVSKEGVDAPPESSRASHLSHLSQDRDYGGPGLTQTQIWTLFVNGCAPFVALPSFSQCVGPS